MPAALAIPAIISAGAAIGGSAIAAKSANKQAKTTADSNNQALKIQDDASKRAEQTAREQLDYDRWLQSATSAARQPFLDRATEAMGDTGSTYSPAPYAAAAPFQAPSRDEALNDPGFQASQAAVQKQLEHGAAAHGNLLTGGTQEDIAGTLGGRAEDRYGEVYNRAQSLYGLNEGLRKQAYDTNNQNEFNAASLRQSASLARVNELLSLAGLASPGAYPGARSGTSATTGPASWQPGMAPAGGDPSLDQPRGYLSDPGYGGTGDPQTLPYGPSYMDGNLAGLNGTIKPSSQMRSVYA